MREGRPLRVALVRETGTGELRPLLLPKEVGGFQQLHVELLVEAGLGSAVDFDDAEYAAAAPQVRVVDEDVAWRTADVLLKLKRPTLAELTRLRTGTTVAALFHAEVAPDLVDRLLDARLRAYSYEYFRDSSGEHPLMAATGEIAGKQAIIYAAYHLQSHLEGAGRLLTSSQFASSPVIAVLGYGHAGRAAAALARAMGAETFVFRWREQDNLDPVASSPGLTFLPWRADIAERVIPTCDALIGTIRISTFDTLPFVTENIVRRMRPGSVIVDVTAGYGSGYISTSARTTTLLQPYVMVHGVKHIKIRELPLGVHRSAAQQISACYGPHLVALVRALSDGGTYEIAERGKITEYGRITNDHVRRHFELRYNE